MMNQGPSYYSQNSNDHAASGEFNVGLGGDVNTPLLAQNPYSRSNAGPPINPYAKATQAEVNGGGVLEVSQGSDQSIGRQYRQTLSKQQTKNADGQASATDGVPSLEEAFF